MSEPNNAMPHAAMNASRERGAWSTSGYLMLILFLTLLVLTIWRIIAVVGGDQPRSEMFGFVVGVGLAMFALLLISSGF